MNPQIEIVLQVLAAFVAGVIIGLDREKSGKPAGIRTQMLVCVGSALLAGISVHLRESYMSTNADPARLMAQIVSGIGFLGAGIIIKNGNKVSGLTTAATIWTTSAIGISIGSGFYLPAMLTTGLVLLLNPMAHLQYVYGLKSDFYLLKVKRRRQEEVGPIIENFKITIRHKHLSRTEAAFTIISSHQRNQKLEKSLERRGISFVIEESDGKINDIF